jgi:hypothetical protein
MNTTLVFFAWSYVCLKDMYSKYRINNQYVLFMRQLHINDAKIIQALDYCDIVTLLFAKQCDIF